VKKILVLGSSGFLGKYLCKYLKKKNLKVYEQGRKKNSQIKLDLLNKDKLKLVILKIKPDIIINLVAETNLEKCEKSLIYAKKMNIETIKNVVESINEIENNRKPFLIHFSTDNVYSGKGPHNEKRIKPLNNYGKTKYLGEKEASKVSSIVFRTNFIGKNKKSLTNWIINSLKNKKKIDVYKNIFFSPLHLSTISKVVVKAIQSKFTGIFNLGSENSINKADYAFKICKKLKLNKKFLYAVNYTNKTKHVKRPLDMSLNIKKIKKKFKLPMFKLDKQINLTLKEFK